MPNLATPIRRQLSTTRLSAASFASEYSPRQPWVIRPNCSTCVASTIKRPAPELASMPRWVKCQSLAQPSSALYWHIGDTTMRLSTSRPANASGENKALVMGARSVVGCEALGCEELGCEEMDCEEMGGLAAAFSA